MSDKRCCVQSCLRRPRNSFLYPFPNDTVLKEIWRNKLKVKRSDVTQLVVCGLHFRNSDFKQSSLSCERTRRSKRPVRISLNTTAIPSKNLPSEKGHPTNGDDASRSIKDTSATEKRRYRRCVVPDCRQLGDGVNVTLFAMPINKKERSVWKKRLDIEHLQLKESLHVVCNNHFNYTDFYPGGKKLMKNALPTLNPKFFVRKRVAASAPDDEHIDNEPTKLNEETALPDTENSGDVVVCNGDNFVISFLN